MTTQEIESAREAGKPIVFERHGRAETNSQHVAACFEQQHEEVVRSIRNLVQLEPSLSQHNFCATEYADNRGKMHLAYDMDRDGFALIATGFTGPNALKFTLAYIAEFSRVEAALHASPANDDAPGQHREFPDWPLDELRAKRGVIEMYRMTFGPLSAQWMLPQLGFPLPPLDFIEIGRQLRLALDGLPPHPANAGPGVA